MIIEKPSSLGHIRRTANLPARASGSCNGVDRGRLLTRLGAPRRRDAGTHVGGSGGQEAAMPSPPTAPGTVTEPSAVSEPAASTLNSSTIPSAPVWT